MVSTNMSIKNALRQWRNRITCFPWRLAAAFGFFDREGPPVSFVIENADWAIRRVGDHICHEIEAIDHGRIAVSTHPERITHRIVHFGSQYMWLDWGQHMSSTNRYVSSFFHGKPEDGPDVARHIDRFLSSTPKLDMIVTSASLVEKRLLSWGVPHSKIIRIPIGVDTSSFTPPTVSQRLKARHKFNIPEGVIAVGSFQKDGLGWGDGMEPKLIKGPDVYVKALRAMRESGLQVLAFLTGPARGYVKLRLTELGIPFVHFYPADHSDLLHCYHALDLYLVTSREEGGPMGLMESMASGVPVVSTQVGMAPDLIIDRVSGRLVTSDDPDHIAQIALELLSMPQLSELRRQARSAVMAADWSVVARSHWEYVYTPLLQV